MLVTLNKAFFFLFKPKIFFYVSSETYLVVTHLEAPKQSTSNEYLSYQRVCIFFFFFFPAHLCNEDTEPRNHCIKCGRCTDYRNQHCEVNYTMTAQERTSIVLRFYGPVNPLGLCQVCSVYRTKLLLGKLSP